MYDLISLGDATVDTVVTVSDASVHCTLDKKTCMLQLRYGDKLPVDTIAHKVAGNAANNAVGMARLGFNVAIHTILGKDDTGRTIAKELVGNGVNKQFIEWDKENATNASTVINFKGERTILVYHAPRVYRLPKLPKARWAYYSSVGKGHLAYNRAVIEYVKKEKALLGYNPGTYQFLSGIDEVKKIIRVTHALFVNMQEAQRIVGGRKTPKEYLAALHRLGAKIVVVTDGPRGSYAYDGKQYYRMGIFDTPIVERTGAGDAYATGFIGALMSDHHNIAQAMCWGTANSSSVIMKIGPQDGLLTRKGLEKFHREFGHGCAVSF